MHGGLDPQSQAVKLALVEKQLPFREIKVCVQPPPAVHYQYQHSGAGFMRMRRSAPQVAPGARPEEFSELYHSIVPDRAARERVPLLLDGPQRLVDAGVIVAFLAEVCVGGACLPTCLPACLPLWARHNGAYACVHANLCFHHRHMLAVVHHWCQQIRTLLRASSCSACTLPSMWFQRTPTSLLPQSQLQSRTHERR